MGAIHLRNIKKSYGDAPVIQSLSLSIASGEFLTLFGPNGCGKSTLINLLTGLDRPTSGTIEGINIKAHDVGVVFQDFRRSLLPWLNAQDNVFFPLKLQGAGDHECRERLSSLLELIPVKFDLNQPVYNLSGGQAQTICLLRALMIRPKLLLLDEPFSALDYGATISLREILSKIATILGHTTICISHDLEEALLLGDRVVFFSERPARVVGEIVVPFPKPRTMQMVATPEFAKLIGEALPLAERHRNT